jgi:hypothetical protein
MNKSDGSVVINEFNLDALTDDDFELSPGIAADLIKPINLGQCCQPGVVQLEGGAWLLRWKERHPEMLPRAEYVTGEEGDEARDRYYGKKIMSMFDDSDEAEAWKNGDNTSEEWKDFRYFRALQRAREAEPDIAERETEYMELLRELPFKDCELPLTCQEAFILVVACWMPVFLPEIAKHDA